MLARRAVTERRGVPPFADRVVGIIVVVDDDESSAGANPFRERGVKRRRGRLLALVSEEEQFVAGEKTGPRCWCCRAFDLNRIGGDAAQNQGQSQSEEGA